jgi:hypothetical protein
MSVHGRFLLKELMAFGQGTNMFAQAAEFRPYLIPVLGQDRQHIPYFLLSQNRPYLLPAPTIPVLDNEAVR